MKGEKMKGEEMKEEEMKEEGMKGEEMKGEGEEIKVQDQPGFRRMLSEHRPVSGSSPPPSPSGRRSRKPSPVSVSSPPVSVPAPR